MKLWNENVKRRKEASSVMNELLNKTNKSINWANRYRRLFLLFFSSAGLYGINLKEKEYY
jgi:hypothetical protein